MTQIDPPSPANESALQTPVVVKKYANRRLYNTESSSYITLDNLAEMVRAGRDFIVFDARSGEDITRGVLTQIIVEEENKGRALLPTGFMRQLIGFYGDSMGSVVPKYLEQTMAAITRQQEQMRDAVQQTIGTLLPPPLEEIRRQNVAMMERAMTLFTPFYRPTGGDASEPAVTESTPPSAEEEIVELHREVARLQALLAAQEKPAPAPTPVIRTRRRDSAAEG
jgi:polyhydroxyalkanoate synthesis repressor PhaR